MRSTTFLPTPPKAETPRASVHVNRMRNHSGGQKRTPRPWARSMARACTWMCNVGVSRRSAGRQYRDVKICESKILHAGNDLCRLTQP